MAGTPTDSLILAAKLDLDAARQDGDATWIASAINTLNWRLDRVAFRPLKLVDPVLDVQLRVPFRGTCSSVQPQPST